MLHLSSRVLSFPLANPPIAPITCYLLSPYDPTYLFSIIILSQSIRDAAMKSADVEKGVGELAQALALISQVTDELSD